jgi:hypothetical protein
MDLHEERRKGKTHAVGNANGVDHACPGARARSVELQLERRKSVAFHVPSGSDDSTTCARIFLAAGAAGGGAGLNTLARSSGTG